MFSVDVKFRAPRADTPCVPASWFTPLVFSSSALLTLAGAGLLGLAEVPALPVGGLGVLLGGLASTSAR